MPRERKNCWICERLMWAGLPTLHATSRSSLKAFARAVEEEPERSRRGRRLARDFEVLPARVPQEEKEINPASGQMPPVASREEEERVSAKDQHDDSADTKSNFAEGLPFAGGSPLSSGPREAA